MTTAGAAAAAAGGQVEPGGGRMLADGREALRRLRLSGREAQEVDGGKVRISPPLPACLKGKAAEVKPAILAALRAEEALAAEDASEPWPPVIRLPICWREEHRLDRRALLRRLACCEDPTAKAELCAMLAAPPPASEEAWMALGQAWLEAEHGLRQRGLLPVYDWPAVRQSGGEAELARGVSPVPPHGPAPSAAAPARR